VKHLRRAFLWIALLTASAAIAGTIDIIQLRYRTAQELTPLIVPHLSATASLTGTNDRLIIRADAADIAIARQLASELDQPPRSVLVSVRQGNETSDSHSGFAASGNSRSGGRVQIHRSNSAQATQGKQQVRGLEGRPLQIVTRTLLPVTGHIVWLGRHGAGSARQTQLVELEGGLYALPRLHGDRLEIDILVQDRSKSDPLTSRRVVTTVSGQVGEWIAFASTGGSDRDSGQGLVHRSQSAHQQAETLWLRVDVLD
jgi:hypothetical protein